MLPDPIVQEERSTSSAIASMQSPLRVAFNGSAMLSTLTGIGQYSKNLAECLLATGEVDLDFFYGSYWSQDIRESPVRNMASLKSAIKRLVPRPYSVSRALLSWRFTRGVKGLKSDLYHEPNFIPYRFSGPTVITAHDLSWIRYPGTHPADRVSVMNRLFPRALERSAHVVTDAEYVRRELIDEFGLSPDRITAIPLGSRSIFRPRPAEQCADTLARRNLGYRSYLLSVGTLEPRKNLQLVIRSFSQMPEAFRRRYPLVIVGMKGWLTSELESMLGPMIASGDVRPLGFASDAELADLYSAAHVLIYPSLYEGFGLPPLEAMASGTPVIVSNRSTLPEVVGDAGILVDAEDDQALIAALTQLSDDPACWQSRAAAGLARASQYSWQRCARETLAVYRRVVASA